MGVFTSNYSMEDWPGQKKSHAPIFFQHTRSNTFLFFNNNKNQFHLGTLTVVFLLIFDR